MQKDKNILVTDKMIYFTKLKLMSKKIMKDKLVIQNISKSYNKKPVLSDISIELNQGEAVGLLGPNGAGKTTLFGIIIGIIKTDSGRLSLKDHDITNLPIYIRARLGISYLPQGIFDF